MPQLVKYYKSGYPASINQWNTSFRVVPAVTMHATILKMRRAVWLAKGTGLWKFKTLAFLLTTPLPLFQDQASYLSQRLAVTLRAPGYAYGELLELLSNAFGGGGGAPGYSSSISI